MCHTPEVTTEIPASGLEGSLLKLSITNERAGTATCVVVAIDGKHEHAKLMASIRA